MTCTNIPILPLGDVQEKNERSNDDPKPSPCTGSYNYSVLILFRVRQPLIIWCLLSRRWRNLEFSTQYLSKMVCDNDTIDANKSSSNIYQVPHTYIRRVRPKQTACNIYIYIIYSWYKTAALRAKQRNPFHQLPHACMHACAQITDRRTKNYPSY